LLILANLFVFLPASLGVGTSLWVNLTKDGTMSRSAAIQWSLISSFNQMCNAKAYVLAWTIMFASGIWPYGKVLTLLACMVVKPNRLFSVTLRQRLLVFIDAVGKVSLLDSFFMFLYESLISVSWSSPDGTQKLSATIEPEGGFILFFGGTIMCLLLGHAVLLFQRLSQRQDKTRQASGGEVFSLHSAAPQALQVCVPLLLVASTVLFPFAVFMTSLKTHVTGGLGFFYALVDASADADISVYTVVTGPGRSLGYGPWSQFGWRMVLVGSTVLFAIIIPAFYCLGLIAMWFTPLRRKGRFTGLAVLQCLRAWAALDICAFTLLVAWKFGPPFFRSFTMDPSQAFAGICTGLHDVAKINCFDLVVTPQAGLWIALVQSILTLGVSIVICRQADIWLSMSGSCESQNIPGSVTDTSGVGAELEGGSQASLPIQCGS